jgi:hypothetical protein
METTWWRTGGAEDCLTEETSRDPCPVEEKRLQLGHHAPPQKVGQQPRSEAHRDGRETTWLAPP